VRACVGGQPLGLAARPAQPLRTSGCGACPHASTPTRAAVGGEDAPLVRSLAATPGLLTITAVALVAIRGVHLQAPIVWAPVVDLARLGGVVVEGAVFVVDVDGGHDWLEPTSPLNSHALRVLA